MSDFSNLAIQYMEKAGLDRKAAAEKMAEDLLRPGQLKGELRQQVIHYACWQMCRVVSHRVRSQLFNGSPDDQKKHAAKATAMLFEYAEITLYAMPLSTGKLLGEATKAELLEEAERYETLAEQNYSHAYFCQNVAQKLPSDDAVVSEHLSVEELQELRK